MYLTNFTWFYNVYHTMPHICRSAWTLLSTENSLIGKYLRAKKTHIEDIIENGILVLVILFPNHFGITFWPRSNIFHWKFMWSIQISVSFDRFSGQSVWKDTTRKKKLNFLVVHLSLTFGEMSSCQSYQFTYVISKLSTAKRVRPWTPFDSGTDKIKTASFCQKIAHPYRISYEMYFCAHVHTLYRALI